jgi:hypothetical protein
VEVVIATPLGYLRGMLSDGAPMKGGAGRELIVVSMHAGIDFEPGDG